MGKQCIAIETAVSTVLLGETYAYLHKGKLCVGEAIKPPRDKEEKGYTWAMKNVYTGEVQYPYKMDIIEPNSKFYEVTSKIVLKGEESK